jgi:hypothetical protein
VDSGGEGVWRVETPDDRAWLETVDSHTVTRFGTESKIRVGVKTTADKVFIRTDWDSACPDGPPELLKPLVTHHRSSPIRPFSPARNPRILYTHTIADGRRRAVDLQRFPRAKEYLERHRQTLSGRSYVEKAGRNWFEIWVPQDPGAWAQPKIVFRDIADRPTFWLEDADRVVNGDCYWIQPPASDDLLWLMLGVGNSKFALEFYDRRFQNRLYGGRRRFMTQYVAEFPLPDPDSKAGQRIVDETQRLYNAGTAPLTPADLETLDRLVYRAFGLDEEIGG